MYAIQRQDVYIETHLNGFVLDIEESNPANGAKVISYPRNSPTSPNQLWYLDYQPDGTFLVVSKLNGKVLDCGGQVVEEQLIVWDRHGGENQRFRREGNYLVTMRGLVVDVKGSNQSPKTPIIQYSKNSPASSNQQFSIKSLDVYIETHLNGFVLDIEESNQENGAKVISYPRNSPPSRNQQWYLDYQPDRTFLIVSRLNGKVLDCVGQIKDEQLIVWDRHGGENQRFKREGYYLVTMRGLVVDVKGSNQAPKTPIIQYSKNSPASSNQHFSIKSVSVQSGLCLLHVATIDSVTFKDTLMQRMKSSVL
ncbi:hypothetical protein EMCRGX_G007529 [Ephydatia muelleri]